LSGTITPPTSLLTAYKALDNAAQRSANGPSRNGAADRFGPAVTTSSHLSAASQGEMEQTAKSDKAVSTYDQFGKRTG